MKALKLLQPQASYRYSMEPFLLASFVRVRKGAGELVDLGSGCGVLPILLASENPELTALGIEIQPELAEVARENIRTNCLSQRVQILEGDVRELCRRGDLSGRFELAVSNPPYRRRGSGRVSPSPSRASARHELLLDLESLTESARLLLKGRGRLFLSYLPERLSELMVSLSRKGLEPKRLRMVHSHPKGPAVMALIEALKGRRPGLSVSPPLFIYPHRGEPKGYTREVEEIYSRWGWRPPKKA